MKKLNRQELATAINIDLLPVLDVDLAKFDEEYEGVAIGCELRFAIKSRKHGEILYGGELWKEDGEFKVVTHGFGISAAFGYYEVMHLVNESRTPILRDGGQAVIIEHNSNIHAANAWLVDVEIPGRYPRFA